MTRDHDARFVLLLDLCIGVGIGLIISIAIGLLVCHHLAHRAQEHALQESRVVVHSEGQRQYWEKQHTALEQRVAGALDALPTDRYANTKGAAEEEEDSCCLCLETFQMDAELRLLPCKHYFHKDCIDEYFKTRRFMPRQCPLCRQNAVLAAATACSTDTLEQADVEQGPVEAPTTHGAATDVNAATLFSSRANE